MSSGKKSNTIFSRSDLKNSFIDDELIEYLVKDSLTLADDEKIIREILKKSRRLEGLDLKDVAVLLNVKNEKMLSEIFSAAKHIKDKIYGKRLVLFAPLYISNHCSNNCLYCGFRKDNIDMKRNSLTIPEIKKETEAILLQGHKRILMLMGESEGEYSFDAFLEAIDRVYEVNDSKGNSIRRINVEIAPLNNEEFKKLSKKKIGTYTVFQETYHKETYKKMHPSGKKSDYDWRITCMHRALSNGLGDVGIGALFGLYDYRFEVLGLITHAMELDRKFGIGPHTISVPRIEKASNAPISDNIPYEVSDIDFKKIVAVLRCAVPYTGIILSTRESAEMRDELLDLGVSQISAGSKTDLGGYSKKCAETENKDNRDSNNEMSGQFSLNDTRATDEVIKSVIKSGHIPSFCTGCYRKGRVGEDFMDQAKPGLIRLHCLPNALTTLHEYLMDYADDETKQDGLRLIKKNLDMIPCNKRRRETEEYLDAIKKGERDLYF